jgi:hypothetical protein
MKSHTLQPLHPGEHAVEIFSSEQRFDLLTPDSRTAWNRIAGTSVVFHRLAGKDSGDAIQGRHAKGFAELLAQRLERARRRTDHRHGESTAAAAEAGANAPPLPPELHGAS